MTYCWTCRECGESETTNERTPPLHVHGDCDFVLARNYRQESVGVAVGTLKRERERGGSGAIRDTFLPTAADYAGPGDPDGSKGIREWNDTHDPRPGNSKPLRPESPRKSW